MGNLLRLEFRKLFHQKIGYVCFAIMFLMLFLSIKLLGTISEITLTLFGGLSGTVSAGLMLSTSSLALFSNFAGIFAVIYICDDYRRHTLKNIVAKGYCREQIYFAKLLTIWTAVTVIYILLVYSSFLMVLPGLAEGFSEGTKLLALLGVQYMIELVYVTIFIVAAAITENTGYAILSGILLPKIVGLLLDIFTEKRQLQEYWITEFSLSLNTPVNEMMRCLWLSLAYIIIFLSIGFLVHQKKDIK